MANADEPTGNNVEQEAADQLATAIEAGRRGAIKDLETGGNTRYYPVVVTSEPLPSHPLALRLHEKIIHMGERLKGEVIKPVTLLTARDVESIEGSSGTAAHGRTF